METTVYLVRHGETAANVTGTLQGQSDVPLNEKGLLQARLAGRRLRNKHFDLIFSSDLSRAFVTAKEIAGDRPVTVEPRLREWDLGEWVGLTWRQTAEKFPEEAKAFKAGVMDSPVPGGESRRQLYARAAELLKELVSTYPGKEILCVSHGGVLRAMLSSAAGEFFPMSVKTDNTCFCCLKFLHDSGRWQLVCWNDTSHLEDMELSTGW